MIADGVEELRSTLPPFLPKRDVTVDHARLCGSDASPLYEREFRESAYKAVPLDSAHLSLKNDFLPVQISASLHSER